MHRVIWINGLHWDHIVYLHDKVHFRFFLTYFLLNYYGYMWVLRRTCSLSALSCFGQCKTKWEWTIQSLPGSCQHQLNFITMISYLLSDSIITSIVNSSKPPTSTVTHQFPSKAQWFRITKSHWYTLQLHVKALWFTDWIRQKVLRNKFLAPSAYNCRLNWIVICCGCVSHNLRPFRNWDCFQEFHQKRSPG